MAERNQQKKKATARQHAQNRAQRERRLAEAPKVGSVKEISQGRFPGETPLTGEDRPTDRAGGKQQRYAMGQKAVRGAPGDRGPEARQARREGGSAGRGTPGTGNTRTPPTARRSSEKRRADR